MRLPSPIEYFSTTRHYVIDASKKGLAQEYLDAQGETNQRLGPGMYAKKNKREPPSLLFGTEIVLVRLTELEKDIQRARDLIARQGDLGHNWVNELKAKMSSGVPLPPVTLWYTAWAHSWHLVSGRHRLVASDELGMTHIPALLMWWRDRSTDEKVSSDRAKLLAGKR